MLLPNNSPRVMAKAKACRLERSVVQIRHLTLNIVRDLVAQIVKLDNQTADFIAEGASTGHGLHRPHQKKEPSLNRFKHI